MAAERLLKSEFTGLPAEHHGGVTIPAWIPGRDGGQGRKTPQRAGCKTGPDFHGNLHKNAGPSRSIGRRISSPTSARTSPFTARSRSPLRAPADLSARRGSAAPRPVPPRLFRPSPPPRSAEPGGQSRRRRALSAGCRLLSAGRNRGVRGYSHRVKEGRLLGGEKDREKA